MGFCRFLPHLRRPFFMRGWQLTPFAATEHAWSRCLAGVLARRENAIIRRLRDQRRIDVRGKPPNADAQHAVHDVVGQGIEIVQAEHVT